jgi:phenylalanyl-tRNA synthetase alpha chain
MTELASKLDDVSQRFAAAVDRANDEQALESVRVAYLGRNGEVTTVRRAIGALPPNERPEAGRVINDAVAAMELRLQAAYEELESRSSTPSCRRRSTSRFRPIRRPPARFTPSGESSRRAARISCATDSRSSSARRPNRTTITSTHSTFRRSPAREGFDSFWISDTLLLRPHTSPMQIRTMQEHRPPIAIVAPGKCFRRDAVDARHLFQFHQVEGLLVAEGIHFGHLKGMLTGLCRELFGEQQSVRFRPSFFPFTEPSAEVDTTCPKCKGTGMLGRTRLQYVRRFWLDRARRRRNGASQRPS